jgi:leucyl-tRNA synthetase
MILVNEKQTLSQQNAGRVSKQWLRTFAQLLSPFAPHCAEELWSWLQEKEEITWSRWPTYDAAKLISDTMKIVLQVNGKVRAELEFASQASEDEIRTAALAHEGVKRWMDGKPAKKIIYVKGKILNVVV